MSEREPPPPYTPLAGRTVHSWRLATAFGAIIGGVIVGAFDNRPGWLWGMGGGLGGGVAGALAWWLWSRPWPLLLRLPLVMAVIGGGAFAVWLAAGYGFITDFTVRPQ